MVFLCRVIGAEPLLANDAARSLRAGRIVRDEREAATVADGARTLSIGERNWAILREHMRRIVEVPEQRITEAVRLLFLLANLKAEPTGALSLGALLTEPELFRDRSVCCIISGGNVDAEVYRRIPASREGYVTDGLARRWCRGASTGRRDRSREPDYRVRSRART